MVLVPKKVAISTRKRFKSNISNERLVPNSSLNRQMMIITSRRRVTGLLEMIGILDQFLLQELLEEPS